MGIYKIIAKDPEYGHFHERSETGVTLVPGEVYEDAEFAPGDPMIAGQESWHGERFRPLGDEIEARLRYLGFTADTGHQFELHGSDALPEGIPANVRTIEFGGDSSGEEGYMYLAADLLVTSHTSDPVIGQQLQIQL